MPGAMRRCDGVNATDHQAASRARTRFHPREGVTAEA
jgi:hypothetical protein